MAEGKRGASVDHVYRRTATYSRYVGIRPDDVPRGIQYFEGVVILAGIIRPYERRRPAHRGRSISPAWGCDIEGTRDLEGGWERGRVTGDGDFDDLRAGDVGIRIAHQAVVFERGQHL